MANEDTPKLLNECHAGIKMAIEGFEEVVDKVENHNLRILLEESLKTHKTIEKQIQDNLNAIHDKGKEPNPIATAMSWLKTNMKIAMGEVDQEVADLMTDGCNMGIKSVARYLNQYPTASEEVKKIANTMIHVEEELMKDLRKYL